jgi:hypothetical protein
MSLDAVAVLDTVQEFMDCISNGNKAAMLALVLPGGGATLSRPPKTLHMNLTAVVERIPFDGSIGQLEERVHDPQVMVDHDIAMVWASYEFFIQGTIHHVGTNIISLLKRDERWLISGVADTSREPGIPKVCKSKPQITATC